MRILLRRHSGFSIPFISVQPIEALVALPGLFIFVLIWCDFKA